MTEGQSESVYNVKAVVRRTGIKPDTLRAWERRYGLPVPERSPGGHRLYSQRDIDTIKWLAARQGEGLSIKQAVGLWRQVEAEGRDPLQGMATGAERRERLVAPHLAGESLGQLREAWLEACLAYDERQTEELVNQAFALYPPETVVVDLLQKAVAQVGEGWYRGEVTVQQEHFCSGLIMRRLEAMVMAAPMPTRSGRILLACPPREHHVIGPLLLTFLLRRAGWEVVYLGANVPIEQVESTVAATRPRLAIMVAQQLHTAATLNEMARVLYREGVPLAYGGLIFNLIPELRERIPGHFLAEEIAAAPQAVDALMVAPALAPAARGVSEEYLRALGHFREQLSSIEAQVMQVENLSDSTLAYLEMASRELGRNIDAALALGDMNYLGTDIGWVRGLLESHQMPESTLEGFLGAYHRAAVRELDERGKPVVDWLGDLLDGYSPGQQAGL